jgi:hypothetical protein
VVAPDHRLLPAQTGPPPQREPAWARIPFYPVLLGFALVAVAYIQTDVSVLAVLRTLGVVLVGSLALYLIVWLLVRNRHLAALIAAAVIVLLRTSDVLHAVFAALLLVLGAGGLVVFARIRRIPVLAGATGLLNTGALALVMVLVVQATLTGIPGRVAADVRPFPALAGGARSDPAPDIYVIMLEDYPRADTLSRLFEYDNSAFLDGLKSDGFTVAANSRSNYMYTGLNLAALLHMDYLGTTPALSYSASLRTLINQNPVFDRLHQAGYTIYSSVVRWENEGVRSADVYCGGEQINEFELRTLNDSLVGAGLDLFAPGWRAGRDRSVINAELSCLDDASRADPGGPRFVWAHVEAPHIPIVFDANGGTASASVYSDTAQGVETTQEEYVRAYVAQLEYINTRVSAEIRGILSRAKQPPVIVLMSDEGSESHLDWNDGAKSDLRERFGTLFAAFTPGHPSLFGDDLVEVNVFPTLLNAYFGTDLPYRPPRFFISSVEDRPDVTETADPFASP